MEPDKLLPLLERHLDLILDYMDEEAKASKKAELSQYLGAAERYIATEGISLDLDDLGDCQLVVMYAGWLYEKRKSAEAKMPRMLRYNLNNRLFQQKMRDKL